MSSDMTQRDKKKRVLLFTVLAAVTIVISLLAVILPAMTATNENANAPTESGIDESVREERVDVSVDEAGAELENPQSAEEELARAEALRIAQMNKAAEEQAENPEHFHDEIGYNPENAGLIVTNARNGAAEYCRQSPGETIEAKQARMAPFFDPTSTSFSSPLSIWANASCSVEGNSEIIPSGESQYQVYVGVAVATQLEENGTAAQGYIQYSVILNSQGLILSIAE